TASTYNVPSGLTATTQYRRITISTLNSIACESEPTTPVQLTVQTVPTAGVIAGAQTICNGGDPAAFTSTTNGTGDGTITYRWESSVSPFTTWSTVAGQTAATYDVPSGLTATTQYRRITISTINGVACESSPTGTVQVTVQTVPTAGVIAAAQTICNGGDPTAFTSTTNGNGSGTITYRWESSVSPFTTWSTVAGQTAATYDVPSGLTTTTQYRRITISTLNTIVCESAPTTPLQITVQTVPTAGVIAASQTICSGGDPAAFTSTTNGTGDGTITYRWESSVSPFTTWSTVAGQTASTYNVPSGLTATTQYRRITISTLNSIACESEPTTPVQITVNPLPTIFTVTGGGSYCSGGTGVVIGLSGSQNGVNYQLFQGVTPVGSAVAGTNAAISFGNQATTGTYTVVATDATTNCTSNMTGSATVTVQSISATPVINSPICPGTAVTISGTVSEGNNTTITLFKNGVSIGTTTTNGNSNTWTKTNVTVASGDVITATAQATGKCVSATSSSVTVSQPPTFTSCPSNIIQSTDANICTAVVSYTATASGTPAPTYTYSFTGVNPPIPSSGSGTGSGATFNKGVTTVTITAHNVCSPDATCTFTVTVTDDENPVVTAAPDVTTVTSADGTGDCTVDVAITNAATSDNCTVAKLTWAITGATTDASPATGINQVGTHTFNIGISTITYTVTDGSGNTSTDLMTVTVTDDENPVVTAAPDVTTVTSADGTGDCDVAVAITNATFGDNCAGSTLAWVMTGATTGSGSGQLGTQTFNKGVTTITYTATDASSNTAQDVMTVTVTDDENPTVTCPANKVISTDANVCTAVVNGIAPASSGDNCPGSVITYTITGATTASGNNDASGTTFNKGVSSVTYKITDASGNIGTCVFTVTVNDTQNPTITCKPGSPFTRTVNNGTATVAACSYKVAGTELDPTSFSDNCAGVSILNNFNNSSSLANAVFPKGSTTVIWTVTDASGNNANCSITVNVSSTLDVTVGNSNPQLYYGYTLDQSVVIKAAPTGGTAPYKVVITMDRVLQCNVINSSGDESWKAAGNGAVTSTGNTCPSSGSGSTPVTTATGVGAGGKDSVTAILIKDAVFTISVTDFYGCTVTKTTTVHSEDDRCFAGNSSIVKVKLCHQTGIAGDKCHELCVDQSAVAAHLAHGDFLGSCTANCIAPPVYAGRAINQPTIANPLPDELTIKAMPNPSATYFTLAIKSPVQDKVKMRVTDILGRVIEVKTGILPNGTIQIGGGYFPGTFIAEFIQGKEKVQVKLIKIYR
ncbi:MAG: HYR domain-containing protein, partial [Ginsengibacter sp.]